MCFLLSFLRHKCFVLVLDSLSNSSEYECWSMSFCVVIGISFFQNPPPFPCVFIILNKFTVFLPSVLTQGCRVAIAGDLVLILEHVFLMFYSLDFQDICEVDFSIPDRCHLLLETSSLHKRWRIHQMSSSSGNIFTTHAQANKSDVIYFWKHLHCTSASESTRCHPLLETSSLHKR